MPGGHRQRLTHQRQAARRRVAQCPGDQRHGGARRVEHQAAGALRAGACHTGQLRHGLHKVGGEVGCVVGGTAATATGSAQVQVGGQHLVKPLGHRAAKTRHHHRQRHGQAQRRHHPADGYRRTAAHTPRALHRQQRQQTLRHQRRECVVHLRGEPGQGADAAHQQQRNGQIGSDGHTHQRRRSGQCHTCRHQCHAGAATARARQGRTQALQGLRHGQVTRRTGGPPAAHHRSRHAQRAIHGSGQAAPLQGRGHACKIPATQVATQHPQRQCRQARAQRNTCCATDGAQHQGLGQHQAQAFTRRQAQHTQQRKLLRAFGHTQRQHREHQKRPGEQSHQRQHRQVHPVGARQVTHPLRSVPRLGHLDVCGPAGQLCE